MSDLHVDAVDAAKVAVRIETIKKSLEAAYWSDEQVWTNDLVNAWREANGLLWELKRGADYPRQHYAAMVRQEEDS